MKRKGLLIRVHGRVQGVGYRAFVLSSIKKFPSLSGYVRNMPDGTVEIFVAGKEKEEKAFVEFLKTHKPWLARVDRVEWKEEERDVGEGFVVLV